MPQTESQTSATSCDCVDKVDAMLAEKNTRITRALIISQPDTFRALIETEQVESGRGKPKARSMFASFCPFCGTKYVEAV